MLTTSKFAHELGVLVLEGVVAVRRRDQDLLDAVVDEVLDVLLGQALEQLLVAGLADALAAAVVAGAQDAEVDLGLLQQLGRGPGHLLQAGIVGEVAAGEVEVLHPLLERLDPEPLGPLGPVLALLVQRVALGGEARADAADGLHVLGEDLELGRHAAQRHPDPGSAARRGGTSAGSGRRSCTARCPRSRSRSCRRWPRG